MEFRTDCLHPDLLLLLGQFAEDVLQLIFLVDFLQLEMDIAHHSRRAINF